MLLDKQQQKPEDVILIGVRIHPMDRWEVEEHLLELGRLVDTAGGNVLFSTIQERSKPDPGTYIGRGKLEELAIMVKDLCAQTVVFDADLSPAQHKNVSKALECKVVDRQTLILDIFAQRALTKEGKIQVMLAQYEYLLPRLTRMWTHLSRTGGGIGTRGPGETQLETDRRIIQDRIRKIKRDLKKVAKHRNLHRAGRRRKNIPMVALVGYTNAGKSTLLNRLCGAKALAEDKLFATLDPVVRRTAVGPNQPVLLSDTVGFIRKLPHSLVAAFKSTLEEVQEADLLLHVVDASHPHHWEQMQVVEEVLASLGAEGTTVLTVYNKIDCLDIPPEQFHPYKDVAISAARGQGIDDLREKISELIYPDRQQSGFEQTGTF